MKHTLVDIFSEIGHFGSDVGLNDKNSTHSYLETYDKLFEPYCDGCTMMEIGLAGGDSIKLWDRYFDNSKIIGVDITVVFPMGEYKNHVTLIEADATKESFLEFIRGRMFDIIIDDSSHLTQDQLDIFRLLRPQMNPNGIYIVEDLLALDIERSRYMAMSENVEILDFRKVKGRFDDALVIIRL